MVKPDWSELTEDSFYKCQNQMEHADGLSLTNIYGYVKYGNLHVLICGKYTEIDDTYCTELLECQMYIYDKVIGYMYYDTFWLPSLLGYASYEDFQMIVTATVNMHLKTDDFLMNLVEE